MIRACVYGADSIVVESYIGRAARAFALAYDGPLTLRVSEAIDELPAVEVGQCPPAGYHIDGTPPAEQSPTERLWAFALAQSPAQTRAIIVKGMKNRCFRVMRKYREMLDDDFGDPDVMAEAVARRDALRAIVQQAAAATSEAELRAAWNLMAANIGGETV